MVEQLGYLCISLVVEFLVESLQLRLFNLLDKLQQVFGHLIDLVLSIASVLRQSLSP